MKDHPLRQDDAKRVQTSFRRGLATYHQAASAQRQIAGELVDHLCAEPDVPRQFSQVFEFGCGTGHLTEVLTARTRIARLLLNDLVPEAADQACPKAAPYCDVVEFRPGPVETMVMPQDADLIVSASTLQWVEDVPGVLSRLAAHLRPSGWLAFSTFGQRQFHELRDMGSSAAAPGYCDAHELRAHIPADLEVRVLRQAPIVMWFDTGMQLLRHLRDTGVNAQSSQIWSRRRLHEFGAEYLAKHGQGGRLPLTYDPVWLVARKKRPHSAAR